jgi:hypothetical protein
MTTNRNFSEELDKAIEHLTLAQLKMAYRMLAANHEKEAEQCIAIAQFNLPS